MELSYFPENLGNLEHAQTVYTRPSFRGTGNKARVGGVTQNGDDSAGRLKASTTPTYRSVAYTIE